MFIDVLVMVQVLHTEVEAVNKDIEETLQDVQEKLRLQDEIRRDKATLQNMQHILDTLYKVERIVGQADGLAPDVAERVGSINIVKIVTFEIYF